MMRRPGIFPSNQVGRGIEVVSVISVTSAKALKLKKGKAAYAIIKASDVMIGVDR